MPGEAVVQFTATSLIESTTWCITSAPGPTPIRIRLRCGHIVTTHSDDMKACLRDRHATAVMHGGGLRVEMDCLECAAAARRSS